ncbi:E3 ubiquitin-protein ligase ubr2 [Phytophthora boehmeriae]|uniref:E3 ubiquitin-protein ligase ubr2 n=1 Tax=Phytophthora boehmeriae TaxID=109152 RepID=A0A8T1WZU6_9STRA|nr:E3 ubiquitin-protein ligase ubr2 [Phytophthora boehmeriae]
MESALTTLQSLCELSRELRPLCETLLGRLVALCGYTDHFREQEPAPTDANPSDAERQWPAQVDAALLRFTRLLESVAATENAVYRLAAAPAPVRELQSLHMWLDASFRGLHAEHVDPCVHWAQEWEAKLESAEQALQLAARVQLDAAEDLSESEQQAMLAAVKYAYQQIQDATRRATKKKAGRSNSNSGSSTAELQNDADTDIFPDHEESLRLVFRKLVRVCAVQVPVLPRWFVSPAEVALNSKTRFRGGPKCQITSATWMRGRTYRKAPQLLVKQMVLGDGTEAATAQAVEAVQREAELLRGAKRDPHVLRLVDIYAFGMTIVEAFTGDLPWGFLADDEVRERVLHGEMPSAPVGLDESVWSLVEAMCDVDRAARPDINTVVEELQAIADEERERDGDDTNFVNDATPPLPLPRVSSADYLRATPTSFPDPASRNSPSPEGGRRQSSPTGDRNVAAPVVGIPVHTYPAQQQLPVCESEPPIPMIAVVELRQKWLGVKINSIGNRVVVSKFLRTESGSAGEIEVSGRVNRGDVIVGINGQNVRGLDRLQIGAIVQSSPRPLEVSFERDPQLLTDSFRFRGLPMDARWRDRGSALPLPGSLSDMLTSSGVGGHYEDESGNFAEPFTLEMWFSLGEHGDTFMGGILLGAQDLPFQETSDASGWPYIHHQLLAVDPMGNLWCSFLNRSTPVCVARELSPTHWYHLVVTYGGDAGSDRATFSRNDQPEQLLTVYLNGEQRFTDTGPLLADWAQLRHVNVGSGCISGMAPAKPEPHFQGWFGFSGLVFDLRVWQRRELTGVQVQLLFRGSGDYVETPGYSLRRDLLGEPAEAKAGDIRRKRPSIARSRLQGPPFAELVRTTWPHQVGAQVYT